MDFSNPDLKELACLIYETLKNSGINTVLVGGACVSIYSHNRYQSSDLDFATYEELKPIERALAKLGFKRIGRQFSHDQCPYLIDFVNPPIRGNWPQEKLQECEEGTCSPLRFRW